MSDHNQPTDSEMFELPSDLQLAVDRARARKPSSEMIDRLVARVSAAEPQTVPRVANISRKTWGWTLTVGTSIAAAIILVSGLIVPQQPLPIDGPAAPTVAHVASPVYSEVTKYLVVDTSFQLLEHDLKLAEERIAEASEEFMLAEVRRDLDQALAQYRPWSSLESE